MNKSIGRTHWIDVAKGILILLLLISHFPSATNRLDIDSTYFGFINRWSVLYVSFYMQAFLFMSGLCSSFSKPIGPFIKSLIRQLIIPFIVFEAIILIGNSFWSLHHLSIDWIIEFWKSSNGTHLWFLNALIFSKLFIYCFLYINKSNSGLLLSSIICLVLGIFLNQYNVGTNFLCIHQFFGSVFFVSLGYVFKKESNINKVLEKTGVFFPYFLCILLVFGHSIPTFTAGIHVSLKQIPIFLVIPISGMMAFFDLSKRIGSSTIFEYFGRNSLVVYCLHFLPLMAFVNVTYNCLQPSTLLERILMVFIIYFCETIICILFIELFQMKPFRRIIGK